MESGEELTCLKTLECCSVHVPAELKLPVNYQALLFYGSSCVFKTLINQGLLGIWLLCKAGQVFNSECWSERWLQYLATMALSLLVLKQSVLLSISSLQLSFGLGSAFCNVYMAPQSLGLIHFYVLAQYQGDHNVFKYIRFFPLQHCLKTIMETHRHS